MSVYLRTPCKIFQANGKFTGNTTLKSFKNKYSHTQTSNSINSFQWVQVETDYFTELAL